MGYPTQKPEALLERIIEASSNPGDFVLDPFCGCGTTIDVAQRLGRRWIGIDVTVLAIGPIKSRLLDALGDTAEFEVIGEPTTVQEAEALAASEPFQFEVWALGLVGAKSVKAGKTGAAHVRDLRGVVEREKAEIGVLLTMQEPTLPMRQEAASAGFYESPWGTTHPRIQVLPVGEILAGRGVDYPARRHLNVTYRRAPRALKRVAVRQTGFDLDHEG